MVQAWAKAGYDCYCFDILNDNSIERYDSGKIIKAYADLRDAKTLEFIKSLEPVIAFSFPPCTDLAVSGAKHFPIKEIDDPDFQLKAMELFLTLPNLELPCPWMIENPISIASTLWRKPDFIFDPFEYGGYLAKNDRHPEYPEYIVPRDAYAKKTCIWTGNGFTQPPKKPVPLNEDTYYSAQTTKLGGKSEKTKRIRSETPRGFAQAVFEHMEPRVHHA